MTTIDFSGNYLFTPGSRVTVSGTTTGFNIVNGTVTAATSGLSGSTVSYAQASVSGSPSGGTVTVVQSSGNSWDENNPFRVIGEGPVQACWKFSPPAPSPGFTNAGLFALAQPTLTSSPTTNRGQNAGIEIANILFIGPQNFNDTSCAIGIDNTTAPYIHDNWFQGWVGDPNTNGSGGNPVNGNNIGGCGIEIYGYMGGGSLGAPISIVTDSDRNSMLQIKELHYTACLPCRTSVSAMEFG